jgi:formylglycine-generating enzyme required for sulfatase activity
MSRIFLSHSSANNAEAVALRDWLAANGWKDEIFLDLDPQRGIAAGERWERALNAAANRCEAVLFLVSRAWIDSGWCLREFNLANRLNKHLFGVLIEDLPIGELPVHLTSTWQIVRLAAGRDHVMFPIVLPTTHEDAYFTFSAEGLRRLRRGLEEAGLDPKYFAWPPPVDPKRAPYRGLRAFEAEDAGIFFGRDAPIVRALDQLRGLRESAAPRLLVVLGGSGAGKSSFLRAGLFPRLRRSDRHFLPLPMIRPERAAINGDGGLVQAVEQVFCERGLPMTRAKVRGTIEGGVSGLLTLLESLVQGAARADVGEAAQSKPPTLVVSIDQGEELFRSEGQDEAQILLSFLRDLLFAEAPASIVLFTIRSDSYAHLQESKFLDGVDKVPFDLGPMPKGSYADVIRGPARRLQETERLLTIEDGLVEALLGDVEAGGAKDALPLLAFTLERLYVEHGGDGDLRLSEYRSLGGIKGSIEAAVERALRAADADPAIPQDRASRLLLLRRGLIPWLASIDVETGMPRRRVARLSEIPAETRPLIQHLVEQRLLATDFIRATAEATIEPTHEALLRQWSLLEGWLTEDSALLAVLESVKLASREWVVNQRGRAWLVHAADRLNAADRLRARPDLAAQLEPADRAYITACGKAETEARRRKRLLHGAIYVLLIGGIVGLVGWINQASISQQWRWYTMERPYMVAKVRPYVLSADQEHTLKPGDSFKECADCPEMIVVPAGDFKMGSPADEKGRAGDEGPQHKVTFAAPFAVSRFLVTFADWDTCVAYGDCQPVSDSGWGRGRQPVINVTWDAAERYVAWLSQMTRKPYQLPSEAEWEDAARAGTTTAYWFGGDSRALDQHAWHAGNSEGRAHPVGQKEPNAWGFYDMYGDVWEWVEDCYHASYAGAPTNGSAWTSDADCSSHVARGGSWGSTPVGRRTATRLRLSTDVRNYNIGFRIAREVLANHR